LGVIVSGGDAAELLEPVEHSLNAVALPVCIEVTGRRAFTVCFRRNCRPDPVDQQFLAQEIAIITFVSEKQFRFADRHCQQVWNGTVIRRFATRQDEAERASLTVCAGVDFRRKATA